MTEDKKATRLSKAAREFNVGIQTIVDFLHRKGFDIGTDPNGKIPPEAYLLILKEYSSDLNVKKDADKLALKERITPKKTLSIDDMEAGPEGESVEPDEDFLITDVSGVKKHIDLRTEVRKPEIKPVGKIDLTPAGKPVRKEPEAPVKELVPEPVAEVKPKPEEPAAEKTEPVTEKSGPKVIRTIDLSKIQGKQEKGTKKGAPARVAEKPAEPVKEVAPVVEVKPEQPVAPPPVVEVAPVQTESKEPEIYRPDVSKLSGLTIVGSINLPEPVVRKPRESPADERQKRDDHKKRERIKAKPREKVALDQPVAAPVDPRKDKKPGTVPQKDHRDKKKSFRTLRPEVDKEDVSKNIRDVNLLMSKGKSKVAKYRRDKRDAVSQRMRDEDDKKELEKSVLKVTEFVSVNELATMMEVPVIDIISTCMSLGLIVSINQRLDAETMAMLAEEFGFSVEFVSAELQEAVREDEDTAEDLVHRPPIVTVMGHVDHGKTKLLDYIRNTNVIAGEAGGITQHIGAYSVLLDNGKIITFLDTPGHEAFTAMRARGAQITDIVIIVVAADDGVMPQTREAINHAHAAGVPIIFAINKIDKPQANADKIREELATMNFLVEEWGGKYQSQEISAKSGLNIDLLLEKILLQAEMLDLKANPDKAALGTVIESSLDKGRGFVSTILVKAGTLKLGDVVLAGSCFGHVKAMYNERNQKIH